MIRCASDVKQSVPEHVGAGSPTPEPTMLGTVAYITILGTAIGGLFAIHWAILLPAACALSLISLYEHRQYRARFAAVGLADVFQTFAMANVGTSLVASAAAYALGRAVGLLLLN
jgi:hypothetical protein